MAKRKRRRKRSKPVVANQVPSRKSLKIDYAKYLASAEWREIRSTVLSDRPVCELCGDRAIQVHHDSYHAAVIAGLMNDALVSICCTCHYGIEFNGKTKLHSKDVRFKLRRKLRDTGRHAVVERLDNAQELLSKFSMDKPAPGPNLELQKRRRDAETARKARQGDLRLVYGPEKLKAVIAKKALAGRRPPSP